MEPLHILIPVDFSPASFQAIQMAEMISQKIPMEIHVLHVIETGWRPAGSSKKSFETETQAKMGKIPELSASLTTSGKNFGLHVKTGELTDQINVASGELTADLIIWGIRESPQLSENNFHPEVCNAAENLKIPVLILPPGGSVSGLKNILLVADFEFFGKGIQIQTIKTLAQAFDGTIHLLQIINDNDEKHIDEILAQMKFFADEYCLEKYEVHIHNNNTAACGSYNFEKEAEIDLVCIRTSGRKDAGALFYGNIAGNLLRNDLKPLLLFKLKRHA